MMNTTSDASNGGEPDQHDALIGSYGYGIGVLLAILIFLLLITFTYHIYARKRNNNNNIPTTGEPGNSSSPDNHGTLERGLDDETINAFPEHLYSKAKNCRGDGGGTGCSVCLQDYKDVDMIRILPECGHFFHKKCVDPWLRLNPSCPICRKSPMISLSEAPAVAYMDSEPTRPS